MTENLIPNETPKPVSDKNFTVNKVVQQEVVNQAKLIIKGFGLAALKPKFFNTGNHLQRNLEAEARDEGKDGRYNGDFGLPTFDILTLMGVTYKTTDGKTITINDINLGAVLIEVTQTKNIITTAIQGRNGTIKEYISDGDYVITIRGVLASNAQDVRPVELVRHLMDFCKAPISLKCASKFLELFGIQELVINSYSLPQTEGMRNVVPFELSCLSETPFEIKSQNTKSI